MGILEKVSSKVWFSDNIRLTLNIEPDTLQLIKALDGLPLALATAGTYLSLESISVTDYFQHYLQSWSELQQTTPELLSYEDRTLYSTWNLSYHHIHQQDEAVANLLHLWAYFDNQDLWFELLAGGAEGTPNWLSSIVQSKLTFNAAMRKLCDHALVYGLKDSGGYGMHHCVHAWTANVLNNEIEGSKISLALTRVAFMVPMTPTAGDSALRQRLLPHANQCLRLLSVNSQLKAITSVTCASDQEAFNCFGILYQNQGHAVRSRRDVSASAARIRSHVDARYR